MSGLNLKALRKAFGPTEIISGVDLEIADGELIVFVGPSGCGKSTLLRLIAGLESVSAGEILIGGRDVTRVDPARRGVAMVFQSYALFPHMTVRQNMGFGMRVNRVPKAEAAERLQKAAALLQLTELLDRKPAQLSGGQRQRVAIGRAIVRDPQVFLFDEPLSNLDAELRVQMRAELAALHARLGATMIYVTHDQVEAMTLADRIVVLRAGRVEQVGAPLHLYDDPDNLFVAGFLGSPRMNFLTAEVQPDGQLRPLGLDVDLPSPIAGLRPGRRVVIGCRPEHVEIGDGPLAATVKTVEQLGNSTFVHADCAGTPIAAELQERWGTRADAALRLALPTEKTQLFDAETGLRIRQ
ncbi:ABC transporter ATP-binding protein [Pleomorphomonas diazotrophica]|uniref:ABC transporter ATP-binding protein n=1 Tax=Pleomorphomonas diazotrophica TaxID=1166257 RepID=A0A1I4W4I5_9HYPH|nr:sn-glycerol-3-phosphate ABC transporter ATP-binding protein UgpC [Pleomorphomonas diazotrophica]PKR87870.1 ABC transporter ATP-binding protein [Pleomorphomonas diazotrophica]SFN08498.1 carbohydrate ABC transporter ATP-binding protein, CUT1 family [Pleomorphomonas diazotrophica]